MNPHANKAVAIRTVALAVMFLLLLGYALPPRCAPAPPGSDVASEVSIAEDNALPPTIIENIDSSIANAPTRVRVIGLPYIMRASLYRDFSLQFDPKKYSRAMSLHFSIGTFNRLECTESIAVEQVWVVQHNRAWIADFKSRTSRAITDVILQGSARNGPHWLPESEADVVVQFRDTHGNRHILRCEGVQIRKTS